MNIKVGVIYEDCAYNPVKCTFSDGDDVEGISMVDGSSPRSCTIYHCGVIKLTEKESNELLELWKQGKKAVLTYKGWGENEAQDFINNNRK